MVPLTEIVKRWATSATMAQGISVRYLAEDMGMCVGVCDRALVSIVSRKDYGGDTSEMGLRSALWDFHDQYHASECDHPRY